MENKSLMVLFGDFLSILAKVETASCFNTLDKILIEENLRINELDQSMIKWNQINKEIKEYNDKLIYYKLNMMNNPAVYHGLSLNKLTEYRNRTITGLKTIKRHALYTGEKTALLNQIAEDLSNSCNFLLKLIIEILEINPADLLLLDKEILKETDVYNDPSESVIKMFMSTSFNNEFMSREEAIKATKDLGPQLIKQKQIRHLKEMSYLCKKSDGYGMIIEIRSTDEHGEIGNEQLPACAHIFDTNNVSIGEIVITKQKPTKPMEVIPYKCKVPVAYRNKIVNWAKESNELGVNNWDYLISAWNRRKPD